MNTPLTPEGIVDEFLNERHPHKGNFANAIKMYTHQQTAALRDELEKQRIKHAEIRRRILATSLARFNELESVKKERDYYAKKGFEFGISLFGMEYDDYEEKFESFLSRLSSGVKKLAADDNDEILKLHAEILSSVETIVPPLSKEDDLPLYQIYDLCIEYMHNKISIKEFTERGNAIISSVTPKPSEIPNSSLTVAIDLLKQVQQLKDLIEYSDNVAKEHAGEAQAISQMLTRINIFLANHHVNGSPWISVEDRLPEAGSYILIAKGNRIDTSTYDTDGIGGDPLFWVEDNVYHDGVTHWMPLPTPPESLTDKP